MILSGTGFQFSASFVHNNKNNTAKSRGLTDALADLMFYDRD